MEINNFNNKIAQAFTSVHHKQFNQKPKVVAFNLNVQLTTKSLSDVEVITNKLKEKVEKGKYKCSVEVINAARLDQTCVKLTCTVCMSLSSLQECGMFLLWRQLFGLTSTQINKSTNFNSRKTQYFFHKQRLKSKSTKPLNKLPAKRPCNLYYSLP